MTWLKSRILAVLAALTVILGVLGAAYGKGRSAARSAREAKDARDYRNERKKIDDEISRIGGADADYVAELRAIAKRRGTGSD